MSDMDQFEAACVTALTDGRIISYEIAKIPFRNIYVAAINPSCGLQDFVFMADGSVDPSGPNLSEMMGIIAALGMASRE